MTVGKKASKQTINQATAWIQSTLIKSELPLTFISVRAEVVSQLTAGDEQYFQVCVRPML